MKPDTSIKGDTPVMRQYWEAKKSYPDSIMLFRMGDFYETFDKDASIASDILGIALTKRANGKASDVPLAGFPYHSLDQYVHKLLKSGLKVAICEQVEDPKQAKGIVKREVVEVLTPGIAINDRFLDSSENNYLASVYVEQSKLSISLIDNSTGEFLAGEFCETDCVSFLSRYNVSEIVVSDSSKDQVIQILSGININISTIPDWELDFATCIDRIKSLYRIKSLKGLGIHNNESIIISCGMILAYMEMNLCSNMNHIDVLKIQRDEEFLLIDSFTSKNLEIFTSISSNNHNGTLISILDHTISSIGSRLLKSWIRQPLLDKKDIKLRMDIVSSFVEDTKIREKIREILGYVSDIYRITAKISVDKSSPRDLYNLALSLAQSSKISDLTNDISTKELNDLIKSFIDTNDIEKIIFNAINPESPINMNKGGYINDGYNDDLDFNRKLSSSSKELLAKMQADIQNETGISNLKIGYNKVFGYYIEVTKANIDKVPEYFIRRQTLTNSERYVTEELKVYEEKIINAESNALEIEREIFNGINLMLIERIKDIQANAGVFSKIDVLSNLAHVAVTNKFIRPKTTNKKIIKIEDLRHPVIEDLLPIDERFIPNDIDLSSDRQLGIITGPNMAGKSTYLRQLGLSVIMHQIGSFIPAESAKMCIVDKLFTRVGASDNLAGGESTFFVEMIETANIINNLSERSLVLLDEIGRGTSTQDGLSIAWSVTEYLHNSNFAPLTLFATHYHELVELGNKLNNCFNLTVSVKEYNDRIVFLRKIIDGSSDRSYGIHVAEMAGLPKSIIDRSKEILSMYDIVINNKKKSYKKSDSSKLSSVSEKILKKIVSLDLNRTTPIEAISFLNELKDIADD